MAELEVVFDKADISYLESAAREIGLQVEIPSDIRLAQQYMPRAEGELEPVESFLLLKIAEKIEAGGEIPRDFVLYLNDRAHVGIPEEDVAILLARDKRVAFKKLVGAIHELSSQISKKK